MKIMETSLAKQYNPKEVEDRIYKMWLEGKYFHAKREEGKEKFKRRRGCWREETRILCKAV